MDLQSIKTRYGIIGNDPKLNRAIEVAVQVAATDLTVMINGESGTGKDVIPRIIHDNSAQTWQIYGNQLRRDSGRHHRLGTLRS